MGGMYVTSFIPCTNYQRTNFQAHGFARSPHILKGSRTRSGKMQQEDYIGEIGRNEPPRLVLLLTFVATAFTAIVFWGNPRFRDANAPLLMV